MFLDAQASQAPTIGQCLKQIEHRINDASNDVNRPPLSGVGA